jgi:hypothetical protein
MTESVKTRAPQVAVQVRAKQPPSLVIPKPARSAKNLLAASGEAADSSRDKAALRNDNSLGIFKLHYYAASRTL